MKINIKMLSKYSSQLFTKKYILSLVFTIFIASIILYDINSNQLNVSNGMPLSGKTVIIDAGHGGFDPGVPSPSGKNEDELNLLITKKLQSYLEASGCYVLLTRNGKDALYDPNSKTKKKDDLKKRKNLIDNSNSTIALSIHQNSFPESKYSGAQVFYPKNHTKSQTLAHYVQNQLRKTLDENNNRQIKTEKYYILEKPTIPIIICECGFLSNPEENKNLNDEIYQEKVAWAIYCGINDYFESLDSSSL